MKITEKQTEWLNRVVDGEWTITDKGIVVDGDVDCSREKLKEIPVKFYSVRGEFNYAFNQLTSLKHCPTTVGGDFVCSFNQLTSLKHCPTTVGGGVYCLWSERQ